MRRLVLILFVLLSTGALLFATGSGESTQAGGKVGGSVSVLGVWGGQELDIFNSMVAPFQDRTGVKVEFEGTRDLDAVLTTRVAAGNPPDLAALPGPGKMAEFARQGKMVDLSGVLDMAAMKKAYAQGWLDLGSVDGKLVGIFTKASLKGLIWYNPKNLKAAGVQIPTTWDQLMSTSQAIAAKGTTPWAVGVESGAASGWTGTDWLENIFLRMYGPAKYKDWYDGKLAWTSPEVKTVWQTWGKIVADPKMVYGGSQYELSTNFGTAFTPVFQTPPAAYFHFQATFIQSFIQKQYPDLKPVDDFNFFGFPAINQQYAKAVEIAGDLFGMFKKTPQSTAFITYVTTAEAQDFWVKPANGISPNRAVPLSDYPDPLSKNAAQILTSADIAVFDASDMMPSKMNAAFWSAIMSYLANPDQLDSILSDLDKVRADAYSGS
ncbi:MAG: ABC transporter substrate-binding protein [Spirochaetia bacterium]|jgi:alpha-glucoside transport system substrate-binding protein